MTVRSVFFLRKVPIISDSNELINKLIVQLYWLLNNKPVEVLVCRVNKELLVKCTNSNNKINIDILATVATNVVTIVGIPSYTSGDQKWNGAAPTLNKKPTLKMTKDGSI